MLGKSVPADAARVRRTGKLGTRGDRRGSSPSPWSLDTRGSSLVAVLQPGRQPGGVRCQPRSSPWSSYPPGRACDGRATWSVDTHGSSLVAVVNLVELLLKTGARHTHTHTVSYIKPTLDFGHVKFLAGQKFRGSSPSTWSSYARYRRTVRSLVPSAQAISPTSFPLASKARARSGSPFVVPALRPL